MKTKYFKTINLITILFSLLFVVTSCEDYLDHAPEVDITDQNVYGSFTTYQGFVEELYQCIPDYFSARNNTNNWNFSNDVYCPVNTQFMVTAFEKGDYWRWTKDQTGYFSGNTNEPNDNSNQGNQTNKHGPSAWQHGWYGIRVANLAIENIDKMSGTEEERKLILGQAYFFRAYFHFAIISAWGGVPYVDKAFNPSDKLNWPRLSYLECAERIAADLEIAAEYLPVNWDETVAGQRTLGSNRGRIVKGTCYGYLGKNWLFAASPLMNGVETGEYTFNQELAKKAADSFNKLLKIAADQTIYSLLPWNEYYKNFWTMTNESLIGPENVFSNPIYTNNRRNYGESHFKRLGNDATNGYCAPTVELIRNFGMNNGLPIVGSSAADTLGCEFNPNDPWKNRDPRFYYSIIIDGDSLVVLESSIIIAGDDAFAKLYNGGIHRDGQGVQQALTGYGQRKFVGRGANNRDNLWGTKYYAIVPKMRLAHVYLMYAEAVNEGYGSPTASSPSGITAVEAVNIVRKRAGVPDLDARFTSSKEKFRQAVRNETAVETCLEGHQWYDYRRWYIAHLMENRTKSVLDFDINHTYFTERQVATIEFDKGKHYWLPFIQSEAALYSEFYQNPGW